MTEPADHPPYLLALRLSGESCLVVGGGRVALRKVTGLVEAGAVVTVVAPFTLPEVDELATAVIRRSYEDGDVDGHRLVIAATGDCAVDDEVYRAAEAARILVNAADLRDACRFFVPAVVRHGPVSVAVSTGGTSPFLASWLRARIGASLGPEVVDLAELLAEVRSAVRCAGIPTEHLPWPDLVDDSFVALLAAGRHVEARGRAGRWIDAQLAAVAS